MSYPKLFIVGHGRHGKDTAAEILRDNYGFTFESSSQFACERVVIPYLRAHYGLEWSSPVYAFEQRGQYREQWAEAIRNFNEPLDRLSREIFRCFDIYVGIRDRDEFLASRKHSDLSIWIDARERVDFVDPTCTIEASDCDITIDNNGTPDELEQRLVRLFNVIRPRRE